MTYSKLFALKSTIEVGISLNIHAIERHLRLVLDLLQSGVDPRTADSHGRTPLHVASTKIDAAIGNLSLNTRTC